MIAYITPSLLENRERGRGPLKYNEKCLPLPREKTCSNNTDGIYKKFTNHGISDHDNYNGNFSLMNTLRMSFPSLYKIKGRKYRPSN